jgi:B12-binding domain/radical SAM domain protein
MIGRMMIYYDVVLIHPPAIYDFRKRVIFSGPIGYTVSDSTAQFIIPSIGILSIADYLDRNRYKVIVDNIGERMITDIAFDTEEHIKNLSARVYAVELHWCVHSQGSIEIAKLCKKLHPDAMVVMGGLTSTVFAEEIIEKYEFVDAVIRGEAEKPFLSLMKTLEHSKNLDEVPNLTYRDRMGDIKMNPLMESCTDLDEFEFTRFDLLEPKRAVYPVSTPPHWSIPVCRGCIHSCVNCGGSSYSYRKYLGRKKPAFRSPEKIVEDIQKLNAQNINIVFLFQDPRMGGSEYCNRLIKTLRDSTLRLTNFTMELFGPASEEYIKKLASIGVPITLTMSPESGSDSVRAAHGRNYINEDILKTVEYCKNYDITLSISTMIALANDIPKTVAETWKFWDQICKVNLNHKKGKPVFYAYGPMILLDPGSIGFDFAPDKGYRLLFDCLEDYINGLSNPAWTQWISYETKYLNKESVTELIIDSLEYSINLRRRYGFFNVVETEGLLAYYVETSRKLIYADNYTRR